MKTEVNNFGIYLLLSVIFSLIVFGVAYRVWRYDYINYPISYAHDGLDFTKSVKSYIETGGYYEKNERLGAPYGSNKYGDVYAPDGFLHWVIDILVRIFEDNPFLVTNLTIVLSFVFISIAVYLVFYALGFSPVIASAASVVYTALPYHFVRITAGHLYLIHYFTVPIMVGIALIITTGKVRSNDWTNLRKLIIVISAALLLGSVGTGYYAFFGVGIIIFAGIIGSLRHNSIQPLAASLVFSGLIVISLLINVMPTIAYQNKHGTNTIVKRASVQTEEFGLQLSRLVVPLSTTIIPGNISRLKEYYEGLQHEHYQYLGIVGVIGSVLLFFSLVRKKVVEIDRGAALLTIFVLLWGMSGGIAYVFSFFVNSQIRAYNRLSVFLAFLALFAFAHWYEWMRQKHQNKWVSLIFGMVVIVSVMDQIATAQPHQRFYEIKNRFISDRQFAAHIESVLPNNSMVFQLPYMSYPEGSGQCGFDSYDHLPMYLHSNTIKWSFGVVNGRPGDEWMRAVSNMPVKKMLKDLESNGYRGVVIERNGCIDGPAIEGGIKEITGIPGYYSEDGRRIFVEIGESTKEL